LEEDDEHGLEDIIPLHNRAIHMERTERLENGNVHKFSDFPQTAGENKVNELFDFSHRLHRETQDNYMTLYVSPA
jgi:hypothetical protein